MDASLKGKALEISGYKHGALKENIKINCVI